MAFAIINALWLESSYAFGQIDEDTTRERFESSAPNLQETAWLRRSTCRTSSSRAFSNRHRR
ncbi:hypothetical protein [Caballeronia sp. KNU42]